MRRQVMMLIGLLIIVIPLLLAQEGYYRYKFARLQYVEGDVILQTAEGVEEAAQVNFVVAEGNVLLTREGRAEVYLGRGNNLRLDQWTRVEFLNLPGDEGEKTSFKITEGSVYLRVKKLFKEKEYEIHTADTSFYVLEEGLYRFDVSPQDTQIFVLQGAGEVAGEEKSVILEKGERLLAARGEVGPTLHSSPEKDAFAFWNEEREAREFKASSRYLPPELAEYEGELEAHGRWVYERPWGYVWVPIVIYSDWRPYYYGRWVWYPLIGWTWIPYESWGWCVFHFGRWHWRFGLGWYWIPTVYWGPAWVYWWSGYDYFGWVPLSYYNRPVVIINNIFYDRYYESVYPIHSRALTVVRKDQLMAPRVHEVALKENQIASLAYLNLRAARSEELNSLVRAQSLRREAINPQMIRINKAGSTNLKGESRGGVSLPSALSPLNMKNVKKEDSPTELSRSAVELPQIRRVENQSLKPARLNPNNQINADQRKSMGTAGSIPGIRINPIRPQKREGESAGSVPVRKKEETSSRLPRLSSFVSSSPQRKTDSVSSPARTSPVTYFRSRLVERTNNLSRKIESSTTGSNDKSSASNSWRLPSVTRSPSVISIPRVSVSPFSSNQKSSSPARLSPPMSSLPAGGSRTLALPPKIIRKK